MLYNIFIHLFAFKRMNLKFESCDMYDWFSQARPRIKVRDAIWWNGHQILFLCQCRKDWKWNNGERIRVATGGRSRYPQWSNTPRTFLCRRYCHFCWLVFIEDVMCHRPSSFLSLGPFATIWHIYFACSSERKWGDNHSIKTAGLLRGIWLWNPPLHT